MNKLAIDLFPEGGFKGFGPLGLEGKAATDAPSLFTSFLTSTIGLISIIAIIWLVISFLMGAFGIITSGGDKTAVETAKKKITTSIIGFVVLVASLFIIKTIGSLLGIPDILNIAASLSKLSF